MIFGVESGPSASSCKDIHGHDGRSADSPGKPALQPLQGRGKYTTETTVREEPCCSEAWPLP